ncbi:TraB/GumN family protein [Erythrobacter mangrovi]|uniref:TraB/GumN family protein n=1 Tax=Erythrobacter mangrovi TaxID=2739433 RepID=A0A7D3XA06_9SPHN|nr:TraB/GumN family protein [Erythrobacter mangrovi]QKG71535.1 TraB/GumN family protein [Erythrobacter mangrovi]
MSLRTKLSLFLAAPISLALQGCTAAHAEPALQPAAAAPVAEARSGPALWQVADEDTTIYLFGTVHALPTAVEWYTGSIATALASSDTLVTEIPPDATNDPASQQMVVSKAVLPAEKSLRDILPQDDRVAYEGALTTIGVPVNAFDRFEPWFAGMTLSILPLMKNGWTADSGVEHVIDVKAGEEKQRASLETIDYQIGLFDELPLKSQIAFLMASATNIDGIVPMMDRMVAYWMAGDADGLATLMNESLSDPTLAQTLLYDRNANWADWIEKRLDAPGTVFIAVGAGHLAGDKSVQDFLEARSIPVTRLQ